MFTFAAKERAVKSLYRVCRRTLYTAAMARTLRIGELARRTGVSPELLRAWEVRYALLTPERSQGGFRLYSEADEALVRRMKSLIANGHSAAEAAQQARGAPEGSGQTPPLPLVDVLRDRLRAALDRLDGTEAHAALDQLFATVSVEAAMTQVLLPYLEELGERWATGNASVAQEHFASHLLRGRLLGLARDWDTGTGRSAILACLPGEEHDLGLIVFGLLIHRLGWRVIFLGADTPFQTLDSVVQSLRPAVTVLTTVRADLFRQHGAEIRTAAARSMIAVAAPIEASSAEEFGVRLLPQDIVLAASQLSEPA
jgi:MerR family transcriptional regulator, light-induced transcriptional regulator